MPSLGADMETGTIIEWRVQPGDAVRRGDIVALVDTEKSDIEVEVFEDGVVAELLVEPGIEVPVGTPLAVIDGAEATAREATRPEAVAEVAPPEVAPPEVAAEPAPPEVAPPEVAAEPAPRVDEGFVRASPLARRTAAAAGVDLDAVRGSGPGGAVVAADLVSAEVPIPAEQPPPAPQAPARPDDARDRSAAMRSAVGALMARSKREIPHYYLATTIDLAASLGWLAEANEARPVRERLLPAALLLKATALAAREVPVMNGFWVDGFRGSDSVHLGVAVSLRGGGLLAPAIHDADQRDLDALMAALRDLVQRARAGSLRSSEMADPTITVTNLGDAGVEEVFGVIYPPQVGLVGFGKIVERPWAVDGLLGVRPVVRATVAADHRASDGHDGARLLATIDRLLQKPEEL